jgi:ABC-2 type transport system permease protein
MAEIAYAISDSGTMLRRQLRHLARYPSMTVLLIGMPVVFLLLFVYVFGGQLGAGLATGHELGAGLTVGHQASSASRHAYLNFIVPGILLMTVAAAANGTAVLVAMDMTKGIIARFRTMAIARASVLTAHVLGSVLQGLLGIVVVAGIALALGFRPVGDPTACLAALGVILLFAFALAWLSVALGLAARSVETASNTPMFLTLLPFLSSGFVTTASMPSGLRQFAEYQPFTPVANALRGLLTGGGHVGGDVVQAVAWSIGIALSSYLWARHLYERQPGA